MKRQAGLLITLTAFLLIGCNDNKRTYHYEEYGLNHPVKSVKVTSYEAESKFGEIIKGDLTRDGHYVATFNSVGNLESVSTFDDNGDLNNVKKYTYDNNNNVIAIHEFDKDGDLLEVEKNKYDEDNNVVELSIFANNGDLKFIYISEYSKGKQVSYTTSSDWFEEDDTHTTYKWDGKHIIEEDSFRNGELYSKRKFTHTSKNCLDWIVYDANGAEVSRGHRVLDNRGRIVEQNDSKVEFNDKNLPVYLKNVFTLNNPDLIWYFHDNDERELYIRYEYDKKGNWVKRVIYEGGIMRPSVISERTIIY